MSGVDRFSFVIFVFRHKRMAVFQFEVKFKLNVLMVTAAFSWEIFFSLNEK